jgi:hypothetical protein
VQTNDVTCTVFEEEWNLRLEQCMCIVSYNIADETLDIEVQYEYGWDHAHHMRFDMMKMDMLCTNVQVFLDGTVRPSVDDCGIENKTNSQGRGVI